MALWPHSFVNSICWGVGFWPNQHIKLIDAQSIKNETFNTLKFADG